MTTGAVRKAIQEAVRQAELRETDTSAPTPVMSTHTYRPYPWQARMHASKARFKWLWVGRRGGKGRSAIQEILTALDLLAYMPFENDRTHKPDPIDGTPLIPPIHIWTVAPTKSQMLQVWNEMKAFIPAHLVRQTQARGGRGAPGGWKEDELNVWLDFKDVNGMWLPGIQRASAFWELKTGDNPEALQTVGLDVLHITEAQDVKKAAWEKVRPTLNSPGRYGRAVVEGIPPMSKSHWFSIMYHHAEKNKGPINEAFHATTFDNLGLSPEQVEAIEDEKKTTPRVVWERAYLALQPTAGGNFFRRDKIEQAARGAALPVPLPGRRYVAGLDLGKKQDWTVLIVKDAKSREGVYALEMQATDWTSQLASIRAELDRWHVYDMLVDSTGLGDVIYDSLLAAGMPARPFHFSAPSKYQIMHGYYIALEQGSVQFPADWEKLTEQLSDIQIKQQGAGYTFVSESGGHDDWVMAEMLALLACDPAESVFSGKAMAPRPIQHMSILRSGDGMGERSDWYRRLNTARAEKRRAEYIAAGLIEA